MKAKKSSRSTTLPAAAVTPPAITREQVQALAHAIWIDRGCPQGCDVEIWLEAERQLGSRTGSLTGGDTLSPEQESVDLDRSEAARVDKELDHIVRPPAPRSPTSL
jgi:hypothetical protein